MLRKFAVAVLALLFVVGIMIAAEVKGKVKEVTDDKVVITVGDKDETYSITNDTKFVNAKGKDISDREKAMKQLKGAAKRNAEVTIQTEKKDGKEVATEIKLPAGKKQQ
jgi:hypothetical protein